MKVCVITRHAWGGNSGPNEFRNVEGVYASWADATVALCALVDAEAAKHPKFHWERDEFETEEVEFHFGDYILVSRQNADEVLACAKAIDDETGVGEEAKAAIVAIEAAIKETKPCS